MLLQKLRRCAWSSPSYQCPWQTRRWMRSYGLGMPMGMGCSTWLSWGVEKLFSFTKLFVGDYRVMLGYREFDRKWSGREIGWKIPRRKELIIYLCYYILIWKQKMNIKQVIIFWRQHYIFILHLLQTSVYPKMSINSFHNPYIFNTVCSLIEHNISKVLFLDL